MARGAEIRQTALTAASLDHDIVHRLRHGGKAVDLLAFLLERHHEPTVVLAHLRELRRNFAGQLDAMLQGRVWLESLALNLLKEVGAAAQEFVVGELPCLHVRRRTLCPGGLEYPN